MGDWRAIGLMSHCCWGSIPLPPTMKTVALKLSIVILGWVIEWLERHFNLDATTKSNELSAEETESIEAMLMDYGLTPLAVDICGNECGCIAMFAEGKLVWSSLWASNTTCPYHTFPPITPPQR